MSETNLFDLSSEKVIVHFKGSAYDITPFLRKHPGGKEILLKHQNKDIEKLMLENDHSKYAYQLLESYKMDDKILS